MYRIIHAYTRLTFNLYYSDYTTSVYSLLSSLKWLTYKNRCPFKLLYLTHILLLTYQLSYLYNLIVPMHPISSFKSTRAIQLNTYPYNKKRFLDRYFKFMSPISSNYIPINKMNI